MEENEINEIINMLNSDMSIEQILDQLERRKNAKQSDILDQRNKMH